MNDDRLDEMIKRKISELDSVHPVHLPSPDLLWQSLHDMRAHRKEKKRRILWQSAAAAVVVLVAAYGLIIRENTRTITDGPAPLAWSVREQHALDFIEMYCAKKNIACQDPVIRELRIDLERSSRKLKEIDQQLRIYRSDAGLIRARERIERHQAQVIKTIIQTL